VRSSQNYYQVVKRCMDEATLLTNCNLIANDRMASSEHEENFVIQKDLAINLDSDGTSDGCITPRSMEEKDHQEDSQGLEVNSSLKKVLSRRNFRSIFLL
jgi:hypothetical protein